MHYSCSIAPLTRQSSCSEIQLVIRRGKPVGCDSTIAGFLFLTGWLIWTGALCRAVASSRRILGCLSVADETVPIAWNFGTTGYHALTALDTSCKSYCSPPSCVGRHWVDEMKYIRSPGRRRWRQVCLRDSDGDAGYRLRVATMPIHNSAWAGREWT